MLVGLLSEWVFPPWISVDQLPGMSEKDEPIGHHWILAPDLQELSARQGYAIHWSALVLESLAVLAAGLLLFKLGDLLPRGSARARNVRRDFTRESTLEPERMHLVAESNTGIIPQQSSGPRLRDQAGAFGRLRAFWVFILVAVVSGVVSSSPPHQAPQPQNVLERLRAAQRANVANDFLFSILPRALGSLCGAYIIAWLVWRLTGRSRTRTSVTLLVLAALLLLGLSQ